MAEQMKYVDVAIIGAGFGGLGVGIALKQKGLENFVIFEGEENVGGSWRTNTYPGCACDVPSHLYSYSFEPNPNWPEAYSRQADIREYIEHCSDKYQLRSQIQFSTKVTGAEFDQTQGIWKVTTDDGAVTHARVLVPATGALSHPQHPDIDGIDSFAGPALHTARWDDSVSLEGKRVGVIGSGASAIQVVPSIAPEVGDLTVFQRTPSWVLPKGNRSYTDKQHSRWTKHPWVQTLRRLGQYWTMESALPALMWYPKMLWFAELAHKRALRAAIKDPLLREKLTPTYKVGCKRALVSDDWFPAFARDNVHLETAEIEAITERGVRTTDGREHPFDVLVFATGYKIGAAAYPFEIQGIGGVTLTEYWGAQRKAYYGMSVAGFPNMMMIMGPNTGPGHTSVLIYQEAQFQYIANFTEQLLKDGAKYYNVKEKIQNDQFDLFQDRMKHSSWLSGCSSWYLNEDGTNSTMWPGFSFEYVAKTRKLDMSVYDAV